MDSITENMKRNVNRIASGINEVTINQLRQEMQEEKREREAMLQEMRRVKDDMSNSLKNAVDESKEDIDYSIGKMFETYYRRIEKNMEHFEKTKGKSEPLPYSSGSEALEDAALTRQYRQGEKEIKPEKVSATVRKLDDLNDHIDNLMNVINGLSVQVAQLQNYVKTGQTAEEYMDGNGFILGASYNELYGKGGKS